MTNYNELKTTELKNLAKEKKVKNWWLLKKSELIESLESLEEEDVPEEGKELNSQEFEIMSFITKSQYNDSDKEGVYTFFLDCFLDELKSLKKIKSKKAREVLKALAEKGLITLEGKGLDSRFNTTKEGREWIESYLSGKIESPQGEKEEDEIVSSDNLITLKELILESGVKGTKARRLLRNSTIDRPYKRWEWDKDLHKDIIEQVRQILSGKKN